MQSLRARRTRRQQGPPALLLALQAVLPALAVLLVLT
jgi:hypothetical protein